jgi:hypothetical protein
MQYLFEQAPSFLKKAQPKEVSKVSNVIRDAMDPADAAIAPLGLTQEGLIDATPENSTGKSSVAMSSIRWNENIPTAGSRRWPTRSATFTAQFWSRQPIDLSRARRRNTSHVCS